MNPNVIKFLTRPLHYSKHLLYPCKKIITRGTSLTITVLRKLWILDVLVKKVITTCYTFSVSITKLPAILVRAYKLNCFLILARNPELSLWRRANARNFSFETLHGGQFTLSTQLIILNYPVIFSFQRSTTVSSETYPFYLFIFCVRPFLQSNLFLVICHLR